MVDEKILLETGAKGGKLFGGPMGSMGNTGVILGSRCLDQLPCIQVSCPANSQGTNATPLQQG